MGDPNGNGGASIVIALVVTALGIVFAFTVLIPMHDRSISTPATPSPQVTVSPDPTASVVTLPDGVSKFCDGTTMIYKTDNAITTQPNSADC
jgi:hypothetical protein